MSELCLINIKNFDLTFEELIVFAEDVVRFALDNQKGVYFNSLSYDNSLVREAKLKDYFLLTDNFYCDNSEFISTTGLFDVNIDIFRDNFIKKFAFFECLFKLIFGYNISAIEVFLSNGIGDCLDEYDEIITTSQNFLFDVFGQILKYKDEMAYEIPNLKITVNKLG